jgi:hypothetical protein
MVLNSRKKEDALIAGIARAKNIQTKRNRIIVANRVCNFLTAVVFSVDQQAER